MGIIANKTPVLLLTGFDGTARAHELVRPGTVVVHHELSGVRDGLVTRSVLSSEPDGSVEERIALLQLEHGCVSCTLREDLLPLLRTLHRRSTVNRIVVRLDPTLEAESLCYSIDHTVVEMIGDVRAPAGNDVQVAGVIGFIDGGTWLDEALGDDDLADRFAVAGDDERTVAQLAVGHVAAADAVVIAGDIDDPARLRAVLRRLAPGAPVVRQGTRLEELVRRLPATRRPAVAPFEPLLGGCPPLDADGDVRLLEFSARRPLHPGRFHEAIDVLLDGVVQAKGVVWLATQFEQALWLESAGSGLRLGAAGPWLAAGGEGTAERWALASAAWDTTYGDRRTDLVILVAGADPALVLDTLRWAELDDTELQAGPSGWARWADPFGDQHAEPCTEGSVARIAADTDEQEIR